MTEHMRTVIFDCPDGDPTVAMLRWLSTGEEILNGKALSIDLVQPQRLITGTLFYSDGNIEDVLVVTPKGANRG